MTPQPMANTFVDTAGREWPLRITLGILPKLKSLGVDIGFAVESVPAVVDAAFGSPMQAGRVLWTLVEPLAKERGVSPQGFADAMDGPTMAAAVDAFAGAVVDFTHRPTVAPAVKEALRATMSQAEAMAAARVSTLIVRAGGPLAMPASATPAG